MNQLIKKILLENEEDIDSFFKPKNISSRKEKLQKEREEFFSKIKSGLSKIKTDYENQNYQSESEKLFLEFFSQLHLDEKCVKEWYGYFLKNDKNNKRCFFKLDVQYFDISYKYIWSIFRKQFSFGYRDIQSFMRNMLNKYLKLNEFTPHVNDYFA